MEYRHELKYIVTEKELALIESRIKPFCKLDEHAVEKGLYQIRSIYLDDRYNTCFYENENGTDPREKFRIRIYNCDASHISLECKSKCHSMTHKEVYRLSVQQCEQLMEGKMVEEADSDLLRKVCMQYASRQLRPKVIVNYERVPYIYAAGNVRITFDRKLGSSTRLEDFFNPQAAFRPVMPIGKQILEVKYDELLPDFLYQIMNLGSLQQTSFSKYYMCRKYSK